MTFIKILTERTATKLSETKIIDENIKRRCREHSKFKSGHGWTTLKKFQNRSKL